MTINEAMKLINNEIIVVDKETNNINDFQNQIVDKNEYDKT